MSTYRPPIGTSPQDERADFFTLNAFPSVNSTIITGDLNGHHPAWDVPCLNPDGVGARTYEWTAPQEWQVLNSGAPTRAGNGESAHLATPDVTLTRNDTAWRCTWAVGTDPGSDHLPQVVSATTTVAARGVSGTHAGPSTRQTGLPSPPDARKPWPT